MNDLFAPKTPYLIGREAYINAIQYAITDAPRCHVFFFVGPGGIGKTRLLEEVAQIKESAETDGSTFRWSGIVDLYHTQHHSPDNLRRVLVEKLDPDNEYFQAYREKEEEFERLVKAQVSVQQLEVLRRELNTLFQKGYAALAKQHRIVLTFDTLELVQYESDIVQELCQVEDVDTVIKDWLLEQVSHFPNTVTLFAGRPRPQVQADFDREFSRARLSYHPFFIEEFSAEETWQYLQALGELHPELLEELRGERERIYRITSGRPIYLALLVEFMWDGATISDIFPVSDVSDQERQVVDQKAVGRQLFEHLLHGLPDPFNQIITPLMYARKGLDAHLLQAYMAGFWSLEEAQENLAQMCRSAFVKTPSSIEAESGHTPPNSLVLFLHDEVYDLFDEYFRDDPRLVSEYKLFANYYEQLYQSTPSLEREKLKEAWLYYEFQVDMAKAYVEKYMPWNEEAIKSFESGLDMRLREELLSFTNRYINQASPFYDQRVTAKVDEKMLADIQRDSAVRWVKRYLARGEYEKALEIAESIRYSSHPTFEWDMVEDPLYKGGLLVTWAEAMIYNGKPEETVRRRLERAIEELEKKQAWNENERSWRARILGRAYNNIGYLYRTRGHYGQALEQYKRALRFFKEARLDDEYANTLNNLAFLFGQLGRPHIAGEHLDQALRIRRQLGRRFPIALSYNTLGIIHAYQEHPMWGERRCLEALRIFEELRISRGIGLACNGLGFTLRKRGNQWQKAGVYQPDEAENFFADAENYLKRAVRIFSEEVNEPLRLWEAYNELGQLYCDWGWLKWQRFKGLESARQQYRQSIQYQKEALAAAQKANLQFQLTDSADDLAQVYGDQSFLLAELGKAEIASDSLETAESYLKQVERMVPPIYHLVAGKGFRDAPEAGEAYWLSLGKVNHQRGVWTFRQIERTPLIESERERKIQDAIRYFTLAIAYFYIFWPRSYLSSKLRRTFATHLRDLGVRADVACAQIQEIAAEYHLDVTNLLQTIDDILGR